MTDDLTELQEIAQAWQATLERLDQIALQHGRRVQRMHGECHRPPAEFYVFRAGYRAGLRAAAGRAAPPAKLPK